MTKREEERKALARLYSRSLALAPRIRLAKVSGYLPHDVTTKWEEAVEEVARHYIARPRRTLLPKEGA